MAQWPLALLFSVLAALVLADEAGQPTQQSPAPGASISLSDATAIVRQTYGGRVVSAVEGKRVVKGVEQAGYWVRVDVEGHVKKVFVDLRGRIHDDQGDG